MSILELEKTGVLQILVYLFKRKKATRTDLRRDIRAAMETIYSSLEVLYRLNLVEEKKQSSFPFTKEVHLTEKGMKVAEHLAEIEKILGR